jgi:hypothetical protein
MLLEGSENRDNAVDCWFQEFFLVILADIQIQKKAR